MAFPLFYSATLSKPSVVTFVNLILNIKIKFWWYIFLLENINE
ncbi:hypothetical protein P7266_0279 [Lactococcus cremoris]|nr:hypothetical protein P7266_0279 [Lactococcus cremoris]